MAGDLRHLAAFLVQPEPAAAALNIVVFHFQRKHRPNPGKGVRHDAEQGSIAQTQHRISRKAGEELAHLLTREHRSFAPPDGMLRAPDRGGRVHREELAEDHPIEEHPDGRQMLLDRGPGADPARVLHPSRHMDGLHPGELFHPVLPAPSRELADGTVVGAPGIRVGDLGGEELPEAPGGGVAPEKEDRRRGRTEPLDFPALDFGPKPLESGFRRALGQENRGRVSHGSEYT